LKVLLHSYVIKICLDNFLYGYPKNSEWIIVDDNGNFDLEQLRKSFE